MENFFITKLFTTPELLDKYTKKAIDKHIDKGMINNSFSDQQSINVIYHKIIDGKYKISPSHMGQVPKDDGTMRTVYINEGFDRVLIAYYNDMFFKYCPEKIHKQCKSYQTGIGTGRVVKELVWYIVRCAEIYIGVKLDLSKYFDTPRIEYIDKEFEYIENKFGKDAGLDAIKEFYHMNWVFDLDGKLVEHYHSLGQGVSTASYLADALLYHIDKEISENYDVYYVRYSDDICIIGNEWKQAYERVSEMLSEMGLTLNPKKVEFLTKDKYFKFLGFSLRNEDITISKSRLEKFKKEIIRLTLKSNRKSLDGVIHDVNYFLYGKGDYSWATSMLSTINVVEDIETMNSFVMDCIRGWNFNNRKIKFIGNLGYENRLDKKGVVTRGTGSKVTTMRTKMPEIKGYFSLEMMRQLLIMDKQVYKSKLSA